ncbi:MAG: ribonuclease T2 family protein [Methyloceanibacter sp.]
MRLLLSFILVLLVALSANTAHAATNDRPGAFDYYTLVLTWTPSYCLGEGRSRKDAQCDTARPYAFTLHGLWPQYDEGWPLNCPTGKRPWVPQRVIKEMRDIMPSKSLIIHEYRAHGTCSGLDPAQYFAVARELFERVRIPARFVSLESGVTLSPDEVERAFAEANPWLKPDMMAVTCRGGNLLDLRICFGRDLFPRGCGVNESQTRLCRANRIAVPPLTNR